MIQFSMIILIIVDPKVALVETLERESKLKQELTTLKSQLANAQNLSTKVWKCFVELMNVDCK